LDKLRFAGSGGPIPPGWWFSARERRIIIWLSESGYQRIRQSSTLRFHFVVVNTDLEKREVVQKGIRVSHPPESRKVRKSPARADTVAPLHLADTVKDSNLCWGYVAGVVDEYQSSMLSGLLKKPQVIPSHGELLFTPRCGFGTVGESGQKA
jgi:hypothetical protein